MGMTRNDYERLAEALAADTYRDGFDPVCHARYVAVIGISCREVNVRFDGGKFARAANVRSANLFASVLNAIDAKSMRAFGEV